MNKSAEIRKLKDQIEYCLINLEQSRNCDKFLVWAVWKTFYRVEEGIDYLRYLALPSPDTISRIRRFFQNNEANPQYMPTLADVAKQRKINMQIWKTEMARQPFLPLGV